MALLVDGIGGKSIRELVAGLGEQFAVPEEISLEGSISTGRGQVSHLRDLAVRHGCVWLQPRGEWGYKSWLVVAVSFSVLNSLLWCSSRRGKKVYPNPIRTILDPIRMVSQQSPKPCLNARHVALLESIPR